MWAFISNDYVVQKTYVIPVAFYNVSHDCTIDGPSTIQVTLRGKRSSIKRIIQDNLILHIDASKLTQKENIITPHNGLLFVPEAITVLHYDPLYLTVHVHEGKPVKLP